MAIPLDTCTISMSDGDVEAYTYSCDDNKELFWVCNNQAINQFDDRNIHR